MMMPTAENEKVGAFSASSAITSSSPSTRKGDKEDLMVHRSIGAGAVSVPFAAPNASCNYLPDGDFCSSKWGGKDDDMEARVAKKMLEEDDINHKYHQSVMKKDDDDDDAKTRARDWFFLWMGSLTLVFLGLVVFGFVSGIFLPKKWTLEPSSPSSSISTEERQEYHHNLLAFFNSPRLEPSSPQEQAMKWMAFQDEPLPVPLGDGSEEESAEIVYQRVRLEQRYALVTWYFAQGGPNLWSTINRDSGAGWVEFGAGVHECNWRGIDCAAMGSPDDDRNNDDDDDDENGPEQERYKVVVGVRLSSAQGVVLTGSSLSTELGLLTHVRRLDFASQRLEGSIPEEWKHLTNLGKADDHLWCGACIFVSYFFVSHAFLLLRRSSLR
jgi:hypothetical protein